MLHRRRVRGDEPQRDELTGGWVPADLGDELTGGGRQILVARTTLSLRPASGLVARRSSRSGKQGFCLLEDFLKKRAGVDVVN